MKRALLCDLLFLATGSVLFSQTPPAAPPVITGVSNSASGLTSIASGSWVTIYGTALSTTTRAWRASDISGNNLPTTLDGVSVQINGKKAAISYVSPGQLNAQAPTDATIGQVPLQVTTANGTGAFTTITSWIPAAVPCQSTRPSGRYEVKESS